MCNFIPGALFLRFRVTPLILIVSLFQWKCDPSSPRANHDPNGGLGSNKSVFQSDMRLFIVYSNWFKTLVVSYLRVNWGPRIRIFRGFVLNHHYWFWCIYIYREREGKKRYNEIIHDELQWITYSCRIKESNTVLSRHEHANPFGPVPNMCWMPMANILQTTSKIIVHEQTNSNSRHWNQSCCRQSSRACWNLLYTCILGLSYHVGGKNLRLRWYDQNYDSNKDWLLLLNSIQGSNIQRVLIPSCIGVSTSVELSCTALNAVWQIRCWRMITATTTDKPISGSEHIVNLCTAAWKCETHFLWVLYHIWNTW